MFDFIMKDIRNKLNFNNITQEILVYMNKCFVKVERCISSRSIKHLSYLNSKVYIKVKFVPQGW